MSIKSKIKKIKIIYKPLLFLVNNTEKVIGRIKFLSARFSKIDDKKVFVVSFNGNLYGDNAKYIVEAMHKLDNSIKFVWPVKEKLMEKANFPSFIKVVKYGSYEAIKEQSTAKVWIDNARKSDKEIKRKRQYYVQTWHGGLGVKKVDGDAIADLPKKYIHDARRDTKIIDLFLSSSDWFTELIRRAFWFDGEVLQVGLPRNDVLYKDKNDIIRQYYGIDKDAKIVLYAPTFRNYSFEYEKLLNDERVINAFKQKLGDNTVFMVRLHPNICMTNIKLNNNVINATFYPDMQELLSGVDILVSDYSSCIFDYAEQYKVGYLYTPDYDDYIKERSLYFDLKKLPFRLTDNINDFVSVINKDDNEFMENLTEFFNSVGLSQSPNSAELVAKRILVEMEK